jgi:hypothetical protein
MAARGGVRLQPLFKGVSGHVTLSIDLSARGRLPGCHVCQLRQAQALVTSRLQLSLICRCYDVGGVEQLTDACLNGSRVLGMVWAG